MPKPPEAVGIDFETEAITRRPHYPPRPVGVAIAEPGKKAEYLAWGHPFGNNCTKDQARTRLAALWRSDSPLVMHNSKFDLDVAETHLGLALPDWRRCHDTLFLAFLDDPRRRELSLESLVPGAAKFKGGTLQEWVLANVPEAKKRPSEWGAHISKAPAALAAVRAEGDALSTAKLFKKLHASTAKRGMLEAYDRERRLLPCLLDSERRGLRVDARRLGRDLALYAPLLEEVDRGVRRLLKSPSLDVGSPKQLFKALESADKLESIVYTEKGNPSTAKEALEECIGDKKLLAIIKLRGVLSTCVSTFMKPWLAQAQETGGLIHTQWNQVRQPEGGGARTGRLSSTPNFQNILNPERILDLLKEVDRWWKALGAPVRALGLPLVPQLRDYIVPDARGDVLLVRDQCFSDDTEALTDRGWVLFKDLRRDDLVAQYDNETGAIDFALPLAYQDTPYKGPMARIFGRRSTDLLVSPNHRCLVERDGRRGLCFVTPAEYPPSHARQIHSGELMSGDIIAPKAALIIAAALQADGSVRNTNTWWFLKKRRKVERLREALELLGVAFVESRPPSKPGFTALRVAHDAWPDDVTRYVSLTKTKEFNLGALRALTTERRRFFLEELARWDGSRKTKTAWYYSTTSKHNSDVVSALGAITGVRATTNVVMLRSGKPFYFVSICNQDRTNVDKYKRTIHDYNGHIYCVTMSKGTVVVRRNGRVMITGNSQQEMRILAHFENGALMNKYHLDPTLDVHDAARDLIREMLGLVLDRRPVKDTGFGLVYGIGAPKLAKKLGQSVHEARQLRAAYLQAMPGIGQLMKEMKRRAAASEPIRTWGGREYYCEEPAIVKGRFRTFDYKLINVLIQGSAADDTKEATCRYWESKRVDEARFIMTVHDETVLTAPRGLARPAMRELREAMESVEFDVKMLTDGKWGKTLARLEKFNDERPK